MSYMNTIPKQEEKYTYHKIDLNINKWKSIPKQSIYIYTIIPFLPLKRLLVVIAIYNQAHLNENEHL